MRRRLKSNTLNGSGSILEILWIGRAVNGTDKGPTLRPHQCSLRKREVRPHNFPILLVHGGGCMSLPSPAFTWFPFSKSKVLWTEPICNLFPLRNMNANFKQTIHVTEERHPDLWLRKPVIMCCATCGCLAFTISRQSALLPQKAASRTRPLPPTPRPPASGNEAVSRVCPGSPLRMCNTSHRHWNTGCHGPFRILRSILEGQSSTNSWLELPRRMSTTTMQFARRRHAEFARTRGPVLVPFGATVMQRTAGGQLVHQGRSNLVLRPPTWDLLFTPRLRGGSLELLPSKRLQLGASNLRRSKSSSCPGAPVCLSAPTNASAAASTPPRPWMAHRRCKCRPKKANNRSPSRSEACTAPGAAPD